MKKIKLKAIAASLSALMAVSALGITSASAVEITKDDMESIINSDDTYHNLIVAPEIPEDISVRPNAYIFARIYLDSLGYDYEIIDSILALNPDDIVPIKNTNSEGYTAPWETPYHEKLNQAFFAHQKAYQHLLDLGYNDSEIRSVLPTNPQYIEMW